MKVNKNETIIYLIAIASKDSELNDIISVSYTHLDVYKRQGIYSAIKILDDIF